VKGLFQGFDSSARIGRYLTLISSTLAVYRGLPMMLGAGLVLLSCLLSALLIPLIIALTDSSAWWALLCLPLGLLQLGVLASLIGGMMSEPLGRGYRE
jgi:hypothetical protein